MVWPTKQKFHNTVLNLNYYELLRIPGIGINSAKRIIKARENYSLTFEDFNEVEINTPTSLTDTNERDWKCTLLNKHAYSPNVEETNSLSVLIIIEFIAGLIGNLFLFVFLIIL